MYYLHIRQLPLTMNFLWFYFFRLETCELKAADKETIPFWCQRWQLRLMSPNPLSLVRQLKMFSYRTPSRQFKPLNIRYNSSSSKSIHVRCSVPTPIMIYSFHWLPQGPPSSLPWPFFPILLTPRLTRPRIPERSSSKPSLLHHSLRVCKPRPSARRLACIRSTYPRSTE